MTSEIKSPAASVIIAFYNHPDILDLTLAGLRRQSFKDFEIFVADDGSEKAVVDHVRQLARTENFKLKHIWHEDRGFRKNRILNRAVLNTASDYLVFMDMDCIPHREFVREHVLNRKTGYCLTGRRVNLSSRINKHLTPGAIEKGYLEYRWPVLLYDGLFGSSRDVEKGIYLRSLFLRRMLNRKPRGLLGCNFSLFKSDLLAINGFDERYRRPSIGEDSDVEYRLSLNGIKVKSLNYMAVQYHLSHPPSERPQENIDLFKSVKAEGKAYTRYGIMQPD